MLGVVHWSQRSLFWKRTFVENRFFQLVLPGFGTKKAVFSSVKSRISYKKPVFSVKLADWNCFKNFTKFSQNFSYLFLIPNFLKFSQDLPENFIKIFYKSAIIILSFSPNSQKFLQNISYNFSKSSQSKYDKKFSNFPRNILIM